MVARALALLRIVLKVGAGIVIGLFLALDVWLIWVRWGPDKEEIGVIPTIGFIVGIYAIARLLQAPFLVPGDTNSSRYAWGVVVSLLSSLVGIAAICFLLFTLWNQAEDFSKRQQPDPLPAVVPAR